MSSNNPKARMAGLTRSQIAQRHITSRPEMSTDKTPFALQSKMLWHLARFAKLTPSSAAFPIHMEVNLTNYCNQGCRWCIASYSHIANPSMTKDKTTRQVAKLEQIPGISQHPERRRGLDIDYLQTFLAQAKAKGLRAVTWSGGGEPTLHPDFVQAVKGAAALGLEQGLMTNGLYPAAYVPIIGEHLRWIRISLDTLDAEKYRYQKFTKRFAEVMNNIDRVVQYPVKVGINMNLADWNVDEVLTMAQQCGEMGVDYFQIRPILGLPYNMQHNSPYRKQPGQNWLQRLKPLLQEVETFSTDTYQVLVSEDKFEDLADVEGNFGRVYKKCMSHFFFCVLNADGDLCVCMYHLGDKRFSFGNIYEQTVEEIWSSDRQRQVVKA